MSFFFFHSRYCSFLCLQCRPFGVWHLEKCWTQSCSVSSVQKTTHESDLSSYSTHFPWFLLPWVHAGSLALLEGSICVKYHKYCHIFHGHSNTGTAKHCKVFLNVTLQLSQVVTAGRIIFTNHELIATNQNKKKRKKVQIFSSLELMFWLLCAANQRDWLQRACFYRYRATKRSSCCCPAYMSQSFLFSTPDKNTPVHQSTLETTN